MLAFLVGREAMERTLHVVERQHAILGLDVCHNLLPVLMVVQFGAQHLVAEGKRARLFLYVIY